MEYNSLNKTYKIQLGEDNDEIIIGNEVDSSRFEADIKGYRWNNENFLAIAYENFNNTNVSVQGDKLVISKGQEEFYIEKSTDKLKFGLNFLSKPSTNVFKFKLTGWWAFDFYYQEPYTNVDPDGTTWMLVDGERAERPPGVSGSYAVYHKWKKHHELGRTNYRTGKFCHIYRPKFIDNVGKEIWADLNIKDGNYIITIPQNFLDTAIYPVRANDTFGWNSAGASNHTFASTRPFAVKDTLIPDGEVTQLHFYGKISAYEDPGIDLAVYSHNSGTDFPNSRQVSGNRSCWDTVTWYSKTVTTTSLVGGIYWIACASNTKTIYRYYDSGGTATGWRSCYKDTSGSYPLPATFPSSPTALTDWAYSLYATYTPLKNYTKGDYGALPANDDDLESSFQRSYYEAVDIDDGTRLHEPASGVNYSIFQFKVRCTYTQEPYFEVKWNGQSDLAPSRSPVYLQVYNRTTASWDYLDDNDSANANVDFSLIGRVGDSGQDMADYYDASGWISCRVYQGPI